jgi:hypothetical protein
VGDNNITFGCQVGPLPMKYLGVPTTYRNLRFLTSILFDSKFILKNEMPGLVDPVPLVVG